MKKYFILVVPIFAFVVLFAACKPKNEAPVAKNIPGDTLNYLLIADTITYDVLLDSTAQIDPMAGKFLRHLNKDTLINSIFSSIYSGKLKAIDYSTGKELSITEIKVMESQEGYSRELIGKIQFAEIWYYSAENVVFKKEVLSMIFGLEVYNQDGTIRGYRPLYKIYLN